jgi:lysophospholipase L1-like esterase
MDSITADASSVFTAVGGRTVATMITQDPTTLDPYCTGGNAYAFCWGGTNDLYFGATGAELIALAQTWLTARKSAGWKVVSFTMTPRSNGPTPATFEEHRQTFNTWLRANWATYAHAIVDLGADARIGDDGDETDLTYYNADRVHMSDAGYAVVAELVAAEMLTRFGIA